MKPRRPSRHGAWDRPLYLGLCRDSGSGYPLGVTWSIGPWKRFWVSDVRLAKLQRIDRALRQQHELEFRREHWAAVVDLYEREHRGEPHAG